MPKSLEEMAREDLERLAPEAWASVYAERLCDELRDMKAERLQASEHLKRGSAMMVASRILATSLLTHLQTFSVATGWNAKARKTQATSRRWEASRALATHVSLAVQIYMGTAKRVLGDLRASETTAAAKGLVGLQGEPSSGALQDSSKRLSDIIEKLRRPPGTAAGAPDKTKIN